MSNECMAEAVDINHLAQGLGSGCFEQAFGAAKLWADQKAKNFCESQCLKAQFVYYGVVENDADPCFAFPSKEGKVTVEAEFKCVELDSGQ